MNVGEKIKARREAMGMNQVELAEKTGVTQSMICQIERGTKLPSLPLSAQIAEVLQCDVKAFLE